VLSLHQGPDLAQVPEKVGTGFSDKDMRKNQRIWSASDST
jgi:hypothetical protein